MSVAWSPGTQPHFQSAACLLLLKVFPNPSRAFYVCGSRLSHPLTDRAGCQNPCGCWKYRDAKATSQPNELEFPGSQPRPLYFKHLNRLRATMLNYKFSTCSGHTAGTQKVPRSGLSEWIDSVKEQIAEYVKIFLKQGFFVHWGEVLITQNMPF